MANCHIISLNVRGSRNKDKRNQNVHWSKHQKPDVVFFQETYTGPLEETILNPSVLGKQIDETVHYYTEEEKQDTEDSQRDHQEKKQIIKEEHTFLEGNEVWEEV